MNWDDNRISSIDLITNEVPFDDARIQTLFVSFVDEFQDDSTYCYRNIFGSELTVKIDHIALFNSSLSDALFKLPLRTVKIFEKALESKYGRKIAVNLISSKKLNPMSSITSSNLNTIIRVRGIVISVGLRICKTGVSLLSVQDLPLAEMGQRHNSEDMQQRVRS